MQTSSLNPSLCLVWRKGSPSSTGFDNALLCELPVLGTAQDGAGEEGHCYKRVKELKRMENPQLIVASAEALQLAGFDVERADHREERGEERGQKEFVPVSELVPFLVGNEVLQGSELAVQCYNGLKSGDSDAIYAGERTALSEFLLCEHLHALGVPTARAASVVVSRETTVVRDMFYDGNSKNEPTAVVMRIAQSFLRFGSFEIFKGKDPKSGRRGPSAGLENKADMMRQMLDFTIKQYFPAIHAKDAATTEEKYKLFFEEVVQRTARLVAKWQSIGFCHGVLNTDNLSIVGDTLDYGPFGFMEHFNPEHICNTSDDGGRYRYEAQADICKWNLSVLADQLALVVDREEFEPALDAYNDAFSQELSRLMRAKLGLIHKVIPSDDRGLVDALFDVLTETGADFTCTFRALSGVKPFDERSNTLVVDELLRASESLDQLKQRWKSLTETHSMSVKSRLVNTCADAEEARRDEARLVAMMDQLLFVASSVVSEAEHHRRVRESWSKWLSAYGRRLELESDNVPDAATEMHRLEVMRRANPKFVLREHVIEKAVAFAAEGEFLHLEHVFDLLTHPFDDGEPSDHALAHPLDI
ncbi:Selenoprotein o [Globisporangium polare]